LFWIGDLERLPKRVAKTEYSLASPELSRVSPLNHNHNMFGQPKSQSQRNKHPQRIGAESPTMLLFAISVC
jgi:hypothetical protein